MMSSVISDGNHLPLLTRDKYGKMENIDPNMEQKKRKRASPRSAAIAGNAPTTSASGQRRGKRPICLMQIAC
jgi:hypothetical protein